MQTFRMLEKSNVTTTTDGSVEVSPLHTHAAACRPDYAMFLLNWVVAHMTLMNALALIIWLYGTTLEGWVIRTLGQSDASGLLTSIAGLGTFIAIGFTIGAVQQMVLRPLPLEIQSWPLYFAISSVIGGIFYGLFVPVQVSSGPPRPTSLLWVFVATLSPGIVVGALHASALRWNLQRVIWFSLANGFGVALGGQCIVLYEMSESLDHFRHPASICLLLSLCAGVYAAVTGLCLVAFVYRAPTP
jgi:hypothetical protein